MPDANPDLQYYVTFAAKGFTPVVVLLGETPAHVTSGYGGWTVVARQRRVGLSVWNGREPIKMDVPILFDGVADEISQEVAISRLSRMALISSHSSEPSVVTVSSKGVPKPGPKNWVIESLDWGTDVIWDFSSKGVMARLRQDCVVHLLQYVDEDRVALGKISKGAAAKKASSKIAPFGWAASVKALEGDTLPKIASRVYRPTGVDDWLKLKKANPGVRDPRHVKKGTLIRVPKKK
jgi:hypothetical protein